MLCNVHRASAEGGVMARKVEVELVDDLDGAHAAETVTFGVDGTMYEIDLSAKHAKELRSALQQYVDAARRVGRAASAPAARGRSRTPARNDRAQNKAIRDWARRKKVDLSDRGRIPRTIVEQYEAEAGR
jgi:hypothetical protein